MDALGDPTRRAIFEQLRSGSRSVGEIAADLPVSRPAVSQHLRVLKEAGLVTERRSGTRRFYRLDPDGLGELRRYVEEYWTQALAALKEEAEREKGASWPPKRRTGRSARASSSPALRSTPSRRSRRGSTTGGRSRRIRSRAGPS